MIENKHKTPCKDCPSRHPNCHDRCEKFQEWHRLMAKVDEARRKDHERYRRR